MSSERTVLYFSPRKREPPDLVLSFARDHGLTVAPVGTPEDVLAVLNRTFPACVVFEDGIQDDIMQLARDIKEDPFTGIVPLVALLDERGDDQSSDLLAVGVDEVVRFGLSAREKRLRLDQVLRRADRDVSVHPTTRLPGTSHIARDMQARLEDGQAFAVCYADLDHFKEFNDRYGYANGDRVIRLLSKVLRDVVRGLAPGGFVGHIGGDDFIFNLRLEHLEATCDEIVRVFDELIPYQYTEEDRRAGYFLGKDRRGNVHRIPLMALSIGIVTNESQHFEHTGQISELAAEMKSYAKSLPGSKYVVDRRHQSAAFRTAAAADAAALDGPDMRTGHIRPSH